MVYGVCRLILRDANEAEDAAQQAFLSAYRGLLAGQKPREPSAWLGTIARNECRTRLRGRSAEPVALLTMPSTDETQREVGRRAEVEALCAALSQLPAQQRDAIVLREFYGLSYAEVAAALGLSGAAVESLLFRSRRRLQRQLRPLRAALGVLTLPVTLRESLAQALPGFGGAGGAAAGAGALAKLGSAPLAAKVAAATLAVGTAGTVAGLEQESHHPARVSKPAAAERAPVARAKVAAMRVSALRRPAESADPERGRDSRGSGDSSRTRGETRRDGERGSSGGGSGEPEHETTTTSRSGEGPSGGSDGSTSGSSGSGESGHDPGSGDGHGDGGSSGVDGSGSGGDSGSGSGTDD
jgi:RNA polymerase sigma-70 factor (ECF subfamily)